MRLLEQWLAHSALLHSKVGPEHRDQLWLGLCQSGSPKLIREIDRNSIARWVRRYQLVGHRRKSAANPADAHPDHYAMRTKNAWTGNAHATIDPNHTAEVEGDHYLTATTPSQQHAVETIIE
ncbi:hypothetical protein GZH49_40680, partial [Nocardia terpenica]